MIYRASAASGRLTSEPELCRQPSVHSVLERRTFQSALTSTFSTEALANNFIAGQFARAPPERTIVTRDLADDTAGGGKMTVAWQRDGGGGVEDG
jgi:hypothetical protein